jgi:DNA-binding transcriptional regulator GbsR (MarR family)
MQNDIIAYLKSTIDENVEIKEYANIENVPIYLKEAFNFYQGKFLDNSVVLIEPKINNITLPTLRKRLESIKEHTDGHIIILYNSLSDYQRKKLINERIAYIIANKQMYLPFIALDLHESNKTKKNNKIDRFSTSGQVTYLYLLYNNRDITIDKLSKILKRTKMTASRALDELYDIKLVTYETKGKTGRKRCYRRINDPQYFKKGYPYLKSPVLDKIDICRYLDILGALKAGLSALSEKSMISEPKHKIRAITKTMKKNIEPSFDPFIDSNERYEKDPVMQIEVWSYDPGILSKTESVDIVSLKLSLANEKDERIQIEIDNLMRENVWYGG